MNTVTKLAGFAGVLALVGALGWGTGAVAGPAEKQESKPKASHSGMGEMGGEKDEHGGGGHGGAEAEHVKGLASTENGYTFAPTSTTLPRGRTAEFSFRILDTRGAALTRFVEEHEQRLHLIVVRRDTTDYQHLHPTMAKDGTWQVPLRLSRAGSYRAYADFTPADGESMTLGVDLSAAGDYRPVTHEPSRVSTVDGYQVRLGGDLRPGYASAVTVTVTRDGRRVTDLQPYLGAYGHLVALRTSDLAYLHVHPEGEPGDGKTRPGPTVTFEANVPSANTYRLFFDFKHRGTVRTAEFTVEA